MNNQSESLEIYRLTNPPQDLIELGKSVDKARNNMLETWDKQQNNAYNAANIEYKRLYQELNAAVNKYKASLKAAEGSSGGRRRRNRVVTRNTRRRHRNNRNSRKK